MLAEQVKDLLERTSPTGVEEDIIVQGWLRTVRHAKGVSFMDLNDGSCFSGIQIVVSPDLHNFDSEIRSLGTGCAVRVRGALVKSPGSEQRYEVQAQEVEVLGDVESDYPLQKKRHSFEFLRGIAHLRPRTNTMGAVFRVRNATSMAIHNFFQRNGFFYLHSPIITTSDCEGAGEMFRVSTLDADSPPRNEAGRVDFEKDFFGREASLTVSGQLQSEIAAMALSRVYTFGPTFRAENSNTARHLAEFWMVEPEMAFCDLKGDADLAEVFLKEVFHEVREACAEDLEFFNKRIDKTVHSRLEEVLDKPFERMTYTEAVAVLEKSGEAFEFPVSWGADLQSEHERYLTETVVNGPLIVTDYPAGIKAFYMRRNDDGKTVAAMDVLVPRIGEIIGGAQREERFDVLREKMIEAGLSEEEYSWYLDLRRYGSVPHAGFGLGFERAVQFLTGMANIRDVIPFPRVPGYAEF